MRNYFPWKIMRKMWWRKLVPYSFLRDQKRVYFWTNSLKFYLVCPSRELRKYIETNYLPLAFTSYKAFQKEKRLELVSLPHFLHNFFRKIFLMLYSVNRPNLIVSLPLILEILGNMCIVIICFPVYDIINFRFFIKSFS